MIFHPDRMNIHEVLPVTMRTLVVGVGNPILSDDGVGIYAARMLMERGIEGVSMKVSPVLLGAGTTVALSIMVCNAGDEHKSTAHTPR